MDTRELLVEYTRTGSDTAFRELVIRYVDLVYSTALRVVNRDVHRAEDVAQTVFIDLARKARTLSPEVMLGGWLHCHTCFVAAKAMRAERRRLFREREAVQMNTLQDDSGAEFSALAPMLDETINQLSEEDRTAIVLRFFEQRDFRSVGEALGSTEDAARMRITRALDKLHLLLTKRGITTSAAALGVTLSAHAVQSAPTGLAGVLSTTALGGFAASTSTAISATKTIAMTTLQKTIVAATVAVLTGAGIYEAHRAAQFREQNLTLNRQQTSLAAQIQQLQRERDDATNSLAALTAEIAKIKGDDAELLKLRGEVSRLRNDSRELARLKSEPGNDPGEAEAKALLDRVADLKLRLDQMPRQKIPEFQFLTDHDWLRTTIDWYSDSEDAVTNVACQLRNAAKNHFAGMLGGALRSYISATDGVLPSQISDLKPYLNTPVDDAMLARYEVFHAGERHDDIRDISDPIIAEKAPVDHCDTRYMIVKNGWIRMDTFEPSIAAEQNPGAASR
jgi:RNA polymerase sigma factor (sigma-70 family)